jgi:hypothetical protein
LSLAHKLQWAAHLLSRCAQADADALGFGQDATNASAATRATVKPTCCSCSQLEYVYRMMRAALRSYRPVWFDSGQCRCQWRSASLHERLVQSQHPSLDRLVRPHGFVRHSIPKGCCTAFLVFPQRYSRYATKRRQSVFGQPYVDSMSCTMYRLAR